MQKNDASQRQTRSLDNIVKNPDSWRFHDKKSNPKNFHDIFVSEGSSTKIINERNNSETFEKQA